MKKLPTNLHLHQKSRFLEITFDKEVFKLPCEYLRVNSPSAEVQGHGPGQEVLQVGKESVGIEKLEPAGNYALKIHFDDGHNSGIFSWSLLHGLGQNYEENWKQYLQRLADAGHTHKGEQG